MRREAPELAQQHHHHDDKLRASKYRDHYHKQKVGNEDELGHNRLFSSRQREQGDCGVRRDCAKKVADTFKQIDVICGMRTSVRTRVIGETQFGPILVRKPDPYRSSQASVWGARSILRQYKGQGREWIALSARAAPTP